MKPCNKCGVVKDEAEFSKDASTKDGLRPYCRPCSKIYWDSFVGKNREKRNSRARELRALNPEVARKAVRKSELKIKYGLTVEQYYSLLKQQENCCGCCGDAFVKSPDIDHIHGTFPPVVRGLLCTNCNNGLGRFKDSPVRLQKAIRYLRRALTLFPSDSTLTVKP